MTENQELVGASYSGRDPEDPSLDITRWSVTGTDRGDFEIDEDGELSFRKTPDYERPEDSNKDNEYRGDGEGVGREELRDAGRGGDGERRERGAGDLGAAARQRSSYRENGTSGLYTYRASDPEKGEISWSVRGTDGSISLRDQRERCARRSGQSPRLRERGGYRTGTTSTSLTVVAGDQGGLEGTLDVTVTVTDENEGPESNRHHHLHA